MSRYYTSRKRKGRRLRLLLLMSAVFFFVGVKVLTHKSEPAATFAGDEFRAQFVDVHAVEQTAWQTEHSRVVHNLPDEPAVETLSESKPEVENTATFENNADIKKPTVLMDVKPSQVIEVRDGLNQMLSSTDGDKEVVFAKKQLSQLADKWLFGRDVLQGDKLCGNYKVKPGDRLKVIGDNCKVPYQFIMKINHIADAGRLRAGETIKIVNGPFHAKVNRSTFTVDVFLQDTFVRSFPVCLGQPGMETPIGVWVVKKGGKLIRPFWTDPATGRMYEADDPDYPLGARWIGLVGIEGAAKGRDGFAIHGTKNPQQLGMALSRGCVRMLDEDIIAVYDLLMPGVSKVDVTD